MNFPSFYLGASTSSESSSPRNLFYTASTSPMQSGYGSCSNDNEFEFKITTRMISNRCEFQQTYRLPARAKSFGSVQVLPLKRHPQRKNSVSPSPRSPNLLRNPFSRPCTWNDDFDPFQFALEKVSDETRARMSFHRRSHSYSAYGTSGAAHWLDGSLDRDKEHHKHGVKHKSSGSKISDQGRSMKPNEYLKPSGPTLAEMMERRESVYSRRVVPSEPIAKPRSKPNPMARTTAKPLWLGRRVKDANHEPMVARSESSCFTESKMHRVISFLFNLRKSNNERKISWKRRR